MGMHRDNLGSIEMNTDKLKWIECMKMNVSEWRWMLVNGDEC